MRLSAHGLAGGSDESQVHQAEDRRREQARDEIDEDYLIRVTVTEDVADQLSVTRIKGGEEITTPVDHGDSRRTTDPVAVRTRTIQ